MAEGSFPTGRAVLEATRARCESFGVSLPYSFAGPEELTDPGSLRFQVACLSFVLDAVSGRSASEVKDFLHARTKVVEVSATERELFAAVGLSMAQTGTAIRQLCSGYLDSMAGPPSVPTDPEVVVGRVRLANRQVDQAATEQSGGPREHRSVTRREVLRTIGLGAIGSLIASPIWEGMRYAPGFLGEDPIAAERDALRRILNFDQTFQVIVGGTNRLKAAEGGKGPSPYMLDAARYTARHLRGALGDLPSAEAAFADDTDLLAAPSTNDLLLLGGPISNPLFAKFTGHNYRKVPYDHVSDRLVEMPDFARRNTYLRWGFYCGDQRYGEYNGKIHLASRYDEGVLVERNQFGLIDLEAGPSAEPAFFPLDKDGMLAEEILVITRQRNYMCTDDRCRYVTSIGGAHGYSVRAFGMDLNRNLMALRDLVEGLDEYQAIVPVVLTHDHQLRQTSASLEWKRALATRLIT